MQHSPAYSTQRLYPQGRLTLLLKGFRRIDALWVFGCMQSLLLRVKNCGQHIKSLADLYIINIFRHLKQKSVFIHPISFMHAIFPFRIISCQLSKSNLTALSFIKLHCNLNMNESIDKPTEKETERESVTHQFSDSRGKSSLPVDDRKHNGFTGHPYRRQSEAG